MSWIVQCVPAVDGVSVAPCATVGGQALVPVTVELSSLAIPLEYTGLGSLFEWTVAFVLVVFAIGVGIGAILRVIRSE